MTDKTEAQPEALRVAAWLINAPFKTTHGDMLVGGRELRRLHADNEAKAARLAELEAQLSARQAAPDGCEPVWAVFRTRPDENDGKEFLHYAMWHNDTILSDGERYVQGYFVTAPQAQPADAIYEPMTPVQIMHAERARRDLWDSINGPLDWPHLPEQDASRYRYLRARDVNAIDSGGVFAGMTPENVVLNGEDLDAAIDAAMAAAQEGSNAAKEA